MGRHHATPEGEIPFTADEEAARDAEEARWVADAPLRASRAAADATGFTEEQRKFLAKNTTDQKLVDAIVAVDPAAAQVEDAQP